MAHQPSPLKILAIGSPSSALDLLISKITAINGKHGPFDACVIVGDLFKEGSDGTELGVLTFPVPTYFTLGKYALPESIRTKILETGGEVAQNLVFLGKAAVLTTAQGLKIGCVGGNYEEASFNADLSTDALSSQMGKSDITSFLGHSLFNPQSDATTPSLASARESSAALRPAFNGVDLLITSAPCPSLNLLSTSFPSLAFPLAQPASPLAAVVQRARPRYMFWSDGEGFWEREPWGWAGTTGGDERWTRAVKLGPLGGETEGSKKARWFYAFSLPPQTPTAPLPTRPANATPNPFILPVTPAPTPLPSASSGRKRGALDDQNVQYIDSQPPKRGKTEPAPPPDNYTCRICNTPGHWIQDCPQKTTGRGKPPTGYTCNICQSPDHFIQDCPDKATAETSRSNRGPKPPPEGYVCRACGMEGAHFVRECPIAVERDQERAKRKELGPAECWFCLSNPKVTKHLIVAIGSETYVTLPKGQLIPTTPAHIAQGGAKPLVPGGGHVLIIPIAHHPTLLSIPADDAMSIISELESYKSSLRACYASFGAVPVTFEVGRLSGRGGHAHIQIVPVPKEMSKMVAESFRIAGDKQGLDWEADADKALARVGMAGNYFKVECPDGEKLVHLLKGNFDLQFGRMVLASLMGLHHRIDWKDCGQSEAEEKDDAQKFKKAFSSFHS